MAGDSAKLTILNYLAGFWPALVRYFTAFLDKYKILFFELSRTEPSAFTPFVFPGFDCFL